MKESWLETGACFGHKEIVRFLLKYPACLTICGGATAFPGLLKKAASADSESSFSVTLTFLRFPLWKRSGLGKSTGYAENRGNFYFLD